MSEVIDVAEAYDRGRTLFMGIELLVAPGALVSPAGDRIARRSIDALRRIAGNRYVLRIRKPGMRQLTKHYRRWDRNQLSTEFLCLIAWFLVKVTILKPATSAHGYISNEVGENGLKAASWIV